MMNVTGVDLKAGQQLTVKIEDGELTIENKIAELEKLIKNLQAELQIVNEDIDILYSQPDEDEESDDDPFAELDAFVSGEDDSLWNSWFEPLIEETEPFIFNFTKNRYNPEYRNIWKTETLSEMYDTKRSAIDKIQDEQIERVESWKLTDPKRYQDYKEHEHSAVDHWDHSRFNIGDRVQLYYFLDDSPGYGYLKGKIGVIVGKSDNMLSYVQVKFEGMDQIQNVIPDNLERLGKDNKLPTVIDPKLIIVEKLDYNTGFIAYVAGYKTTWEYGESKNDAIHKLLQIWYHNINNR